MHHSTGLQCLRKRGRSALYMSHTTSYTNLEAHPAAPRSTGLQKNKRRNGIGVATGPNVVGAADDADAAWQ